MSSLLFDPLYLSDKRSWPPPSGQEEIPETAEEITLGGKATWIWKGPTYWKAQQVSYNVTAANVNEDGKDCHFFSVDFVSPRTEKHFFGFYDHAPGHIDRQRFLEVAEAILSRVRRV